MEAYKIIKSGSSGNCVMLFGSILVDVGVPFSDIKHIVNDLQLITWSHLHGDHFNEATIDRIVWERPTLRVAVCEHEYERAVKCGAKNIDVLKHGVWYDYGEFQMATFLTYHDAPSNGWRFKNDKYKIFFATDTFTLEGITAKNYTHYLIESNYDETTIDEIIARKEAAGEFAYQKSSANTHLSEQQANDFYFKNKAEHSKIIRLHESTTGY